MDPSFTAVLPLQLLCQLIAPGADDLTNNAVANIEVLNLSPSPTYLPQGYVAYPEIGMAYKIRNVKVSWAAARKLCFAEGSQLALIDTPGKLKVVINQRKLITSDNLHVGIHKFDGSWVSSSDGSPVSSSIPWASDEPQVAYNNCVLIGTEGYDKLYARGCHYLRGYVCEIPIPESDQTE